MQTKTYRYIELVNGRAVTDITMGIRDEVYKYRERFEVDYPLMRDNNSILFKDHSGPHDMLVVPQPNSLHPVERLFLVLDAKTRTPRLATAFLGDGTDYLERDWEMLGAIIQLSTLGHQVSPQQEKIKRWAEQIVNSERPIIVRTFISQGTSPGIREKAMDASNLWMEMLVLGFE